jgi:hypothetical protein
VRTSILEGSMSFIQRELDKISVALADAGDNRAEFYAAQQALA